MIREEEVSFSLSPQSIDSVLESLWPLSRFLNIDGITLKLVTANISKRIHLFSDKTTEESKHRMKLHISKSGKLKGIEEEKRWIDRVKHEIRLGKYSNSMEVLSSLSGFGNVISAFAKERLELSYVAGLRSEPASDFRSLLRIGLDKLVFMSVQDPSRHSSALFHMEVEGTGTGFEEFFVNSRFFATHLSNSLTILSAEDTKWRLGLPLSQPGQPPYWRTSADIERYVSDGLRLL